VQNELLSEWNCMDVKKAATAEIDAVTGATYSSNAVKENVKIGVKYYQKHKK
jgi:electron transport complex protein RnfG